MEGRKKGRMEKGGKQGRMKTVKEGREDIYAVNIEARHERRHNM